jgi:hypothetical protein
LKKFINIADKNTVKIGSYRSFMDESRTVELKGLEPDIFNAATGDTNQKNIALDNLKNKGILTQAKLNEQRFLKSFKNISKLQAAGFDRIRQDDSKNSLLRICKTTRRKLCSNTFVASETANHAHFHVCFRFL